MTNNCENNVKSIFDNTAFIHIDDNGQKWNKFICMYKDMKGEENGFQFWAIDFDDAENRAKSLFAQTKSEFKVLKVTGQN